MQVCQDFLNGRCHRSNCRYQHQARPDGTMPEQIAVPAVPKFVAPPGLDETLYDPMTGFGLFGKPTYGTRYGSGPLPIIRAEDTRPICIEFFNSGRCTRRGPHGQVGSRAARGGAAPRFRLRGAHGGKPVHSRARDRCTLTRPPCAPCRLPARPVVHVPARVQGRPQQG